MLKSLIDFLLVSEVLKFVLAFYTFFLPILLVMVFRPAWLMIFFGAACFSSGLVFDSYVNCNRDHSLCSVEELQEFGDGLWITFFVGGLVYSVIFFVARMVLHKIFSRKR
jgi:hypothetical protein